MTTSTIKEYRFKTFRDLLSFYWNKYATFKQIKICPECDAGDPTSIIQTCDCGVKE